MLINKKNYLRLLTAILFLSLSACSILLGEGPTPTLTSTPPPPTSTPSPSPSPTPSNRITKLEDVKKAVIQIEAQGTFIDPEFGELSGAGLGSGFIIDSSGLAITNNHVVTGAALLNVWVGGDTTQTYNAKIIAVSECSDLALIDINGEDFPYLTWYEDPINVGLEVYAAGFPLGDPEYTLTKGIISKENANGDTSWASVNKVIEHDATINPGNSGGPLVTADGQVVGVNYAVYSAANQYFAIGRQAALPVIEKLKTGQDLNSLGINGMAVSNEEETITGIWVSSVSSGSPADQSGLEPGDLITSMENLTLASDSTMADYCGILRTHGPENTLNLEVIRSSTSEILEGQINGDKLTVVSSAPEDERDIPTGEEFIIIEDNSGALSIYVPPSWDEMDGRLWEGEIEGNSFLAASLQISPDLEGFQSFYDVSGVDFAASRDWVKLGGYDQLLDKTEWWYSEACNKEGRYEYVDEAYEGSYELWECGQESALFILAARPIQDPDSFLILLRVQLNTEADTNALELILTSFDVVDSLP